MQIKVFFDREEMPPVEANEVLTEIPVKAGGRAGVRSFRFSLPILDVQGCWTPDRRAPSGKLDWEIELQTAPQRNFPCLAFFNSRQENRVLAALDNFYDDVKITAKMNQEACTYEATILVAERADSPDYTLTLDRRKDQLWTAALSDWFRKLDLPRITYPPAAWDPVYCSWYAVHGAVTQEWVEDAAERALKLGFKTLIIDDGWSYDEMKRVSPETIAAWYDSIGNWTVSERKFPDFAAHVKRVQGMGMKYLLWTAPFLIGDKSELIDAFRGAALTARHTEGRFTFDPAHREKWDVLLDKFGALMTDYGLDGLKVDFLDAVFPDLAAPRGRETRAFIEALAQRIRSVKADALIEFRQNYATPPMLAYGTQFRAGDAPFDYTDNFARLAQIRTGLGGGDGIPVHADPLCWHPEESSVNVARHLIASLAGVPMLSMDLAKIGRKAKEIIKYWITFYREHQRLFNSGRWTVAYHPSGASYLAVAHEQEAAVIVQDNARLAEAVNTAQEKTAGKIYVLNLSPEELPLSGARTCDEFGHPAASGRIPLGGMGVVAVCGSDARRGQSWQPRPGSLSSESHSASSAPKS